MPTYHHHLALAPPDAPRPVLSLWHGATRPSRPARRRVRARVQDVSIRLATAGDADALARLADLDSVAPLDGDAVVAERDGELIAAVALDGGRTAADPFAPTHDILELLVLRARQVANAPRGARSPRRRRVGFWARRGAVWGWS
jgi:hypothetical protein